MGRFPRLCLTRGGHGKVSDDMSYKRRTWGGFPGYVLQEEDMGRFLMICLTRGGHEEVFRIICLTRGGHWEVFRVICLTSGRCF